jgi:hypothetical protein
MNYGLYSKITNRAFFRKGILKVRKKYYNGTPGIN